MFKRFYAVTLAALASAGLVGCGGDDDATPAKTTTTPTNDAGQPATVACGANTQLVNGTCIAAPPVCSDGTIANDGGTGCTVAPAPQLKNARLTLLKVNHDLTKPALIDNHIPVHFGITANSADNSQPVTAFVDVVFDFVNPTPADPNTPETCSSNGVVVKVIGDGTEQSFDADIFPTNDCTWVQASGSTANLGVDFGGNGAVFDAPSVVFSTANVGGTDNKLCRTGGTAAAPTGVGCVAALTLKPTTGVNVQIDAVKPMSVVAIVWPDAQASDVTAGKKETTQPSMVVNGTYSFEGRHPYEHPIDTSKLSSDILAAEPDLVAGLHFGLSDDDLAKLDDLPGTATVTYDIVPTNLLASNAWMPVMIDDPNATDASTHVASLEDDSMIPGADNAFHYELYLEGATRDAVSIGGKWAAQNQYTVRMCVKTSFAEVEDEGNFDDLGDDDDDSTETTDGANTDCRMFEVRLSRASAMPTAASSYSFDANWDRMVGNPDRLALTGSLVSSSVLDLDGARTSTEGKVDLAGKIGQSFNVQLFHVWAKGGSSSRDATQSYVDFGAEAFGTNIYSDVRFDSDLTLNVPFKISKAFSFPALSFGFGPVSVGINVGVGGAIGSSPSLTVGAKNGGEASVPELANATTNGYVLGSVGPTIALTGNVSGGVRIAIASVEVIASVQIVEIGFPYNTNLRWGVTEQDANNNPTKLTVVGDTGWDLTLNWLNVSVDLVGRLFKLKKTVNIWKYVTTPESFNLLSRSTPPIVLE